MKSYVEEYQKKYNQPSVDQYIVGFSGIDPSRKSFAGVDPSDLTEEQLAVIRKLILSYMSKLTIRVDSGNIDPDAEEPEVPYIPLKPSEIPHEELDELLGGDIDGHYHLTDAELSRLQTLENELIPDGENIEIPGAGNHEELSSLFGGSSDGHYHLTNEQLVKLEKLLKLCYPNGEIDPVIPTIPVTPVDPDPDDDPETDPFGGLPKGTPPAWEIQAFPNKYSARNANYKMYYGDIPAKNKTVTPNVLLVPMTYGTSSYTYLMTTTDGISWSKVTSINANINYGTDIDDYLLLRASTNEARLFFARTPATNKGIYYMHYGNAMNCSNYTSNMSYSYTAGCYSPLLTTGILVTQSGTVTRMIDAVSKKETNEAGMTVSPGCAAWSPDAGVFCVTGPNGTATSSTGTTWVKHTDAPHNLRDLTFREDLRSDETSKGCFFAWSGTDKLFYVSGNGSDWIKLNNTPIPLEEVSCLDYSPETGWYCAIGGTSRTAYFSKDLEHWKETTVTNGAAIAMNSVKYLPSAGKYILMPKSGDYYYTFNVSAWTDN